MVKYTRKEILLKALPASASLFFTTSLLYSFFWNKQSDANGLRSIRTKISPNGDKYIGQWKDGKYEGQGTYTFPNGDKYVGQWKDGKIEGQGTYTWTDGTKYVGQWKDGIIEGQGTYTWIDGTKYVGQFKDGKREGQGTMIYFNGPKYVGQFKNGNIEGQGAVIFPDGSSYVGQWENDELKGQRTYILADGAKPDFILLNDLSVNDFEFVSLKYNRFYHNAPWIVKSEEKKNCSIKEYKRNIRSLKAYARNNDIHLIKLKDTKVEYSDRLIKRLKGCGIGHEISEDLFRPVSFLYADLYKNQIRLKSRITV